MFFNSRAGVGFSSMLTCAAFQSQNPVVVISADDVAEGNLYFRIKKIVFFYFLFFDLIVKGLIFN